MNEKLNLDHLKIHPLRFAPENVNFIVETGGPCAAKTSILAPAMQKLQDMGICVATMPELATDFAMNGFAPGKLMSGDAFQHAILLGTIEREYRAWNMMRSVEVPKQVPKLIITDRGRLDGAAYMDQDEFYAMAASYGYSPGDLGEAFYKAVIHLRSVAFDAPTLYTTENNPARKETIPQAVERDAATLKAWHSHPHLRVISNLVDKTRIITIEEKASRFVAEVAHALGIPVPVVAPVAAALPAACGLLLLWHADWSPTFGIPVSVVAPVVAALPAMPLAQ